MASRRRRIRLLALLLAIPVLASGAALLARNSVPPTYAGVARVPVTTTTELTTTDSAVTTLEDDTWSVNSMSAVLSHHGLPLTGFVVTFTVDTKTCSDVTDNSGMAACAVTGLTNTRRSYSAAFAGNGSLQPSHDTGVIVRSN